jgi:hypothetical protein
MNNTFAVTTTTEAEGLFYLLVVFLLGLVFACAIIFMPARRRRLKTAVVALTAALLIGFCGGGLAYLSLKKADNIAATAASFETAFAVTLSPEAADELYSNAVSVERTAPSELPVTVDGRTLTLELLILPTADGGVRAAYALLPNGWLAPLPVALHEFTPPFTTKTFKK